MIINSVTHGDDQTEEQVVSIQNKVICRQLSAFFFSTEKKYRGHDLGVLNGSYGPVPKITWMLPP